MTVNNHKLARVQAISGLLFSLFVLVHLGNTAMAVFGADLYDGYQRAARGV